MAIVDLFVAGFSCDPFLDVQPSTVVSEMASLCTNKNIVILVGSENFKLSAFVIISFPVSRLLSSPQIFHLYNSGSRTLLKSIVSAFVEQIRLAGYNSFVASHFGGREKAFLRLFKSAGVPRKICETFKFSLHTETES